MSLIIEPTATAPTNYPIPGAAARPATAGGVQVIPVDPERLQRAKKAYTTRFLASALEEDASGYLLQSQDAPRAGDIVLARVVKLGSHLKLESPVSRRQAMFAGDEILVAYGNRYAPDQFLAVVPEDLGECQLVAGGGVAGQVLEQHAGMKQATTLQPLGLLATTEGVLNLNDFIPPSASVETVTRRPAVVAVLGTSMNSGKSTTLGCLVNGLTSAGLRVSAGKATGTGSGNDPRLFTDAGARQVIDFTDFGYPTTFKLEYEEVRGLLTSLISRLSTPDTDVVVVEIADGVYQGETARLLADPVFKGVVDRVLFSAADALGATAGVKVLADSGVEVAAVSGLLTASPLAADEAASVLDVPVIGTYDLCAADVARGLVAAVLPASTRES